MRSLVFRAFTHLQRTIVADRFARTVWEEAFQAGETECEQLRMPPSFTTASGPSKHRLKVKELTSFLAGTSTPSQNRFSDPL